MIRPSPVLPWPDDLRVLGYEAAERETILRWDSEQALVVAWSCRTHDLHKLKRIGFVPRRIARDARTGRLHGIECILPFAEFRWSRKRAMSKTPPTGFKKRALAQANGSERAVDDPRPLPTEGTP